MGNDAKHADQGGTRYSHGNTSGGSQDQGERKDEGWESRQGGRQSHDPGVRGAEPATAADRAGGGADRGGKSGGTNTQGDLKGIREASERVAAEEDARTQASDEEREAVNRR